MWEVRGISAEGLRRISGRMTALKWPENPPYDEIFWLAKKLEEGEVVRMARTPENWGALLNYIDFEEGKYDLKFLPPDDGTDLYYVALEENPSR